MRLSIELLPGTNYAIQVAAEVNGALSPWSPAYNLTTDQDTTLPKPPANVTWLAIGDSFYAEWDAITTNVGNQYSAVVGYELELVAGGNTKSINVPQSQTSRTSYTLTFDENRALFSTPRASVSLRIRTVDNKGLKSDYSSVLTATNAAPAAPTAPATGSILTAGVDQITLGWSAPADLDLVGYNVYVGTTAGFTATTGNRIYSGPGTRMSYTTTTYSTQYFKIRSVDKFGQESADLTASGAPASSFSADTTPPALPVITTATITNNASGVGSRAALAWTSTGESDLAGFYVRYRRTGDTNWSVVNFQKDDRAGTVELQAAYTAYEFQMKAFDWSNNESAWTGTTTANSPANGIPGNVTGLTATAGRDAIRYDWTQVADADLKEYEVTVSTSPTFASGNLTFRTGGSTLVVGGLNPSTTYYARIRAVDTQGLVSASWSSTVSISTLSVISTVSVSDLTGGNFTVGMSLAAGSSLLLNGGYIKSNTYTGTSQASNPSGAGFYLGNDGLRIDTGAIKANALVSDTLTSTVITLGTGGQIVGGGGWVLSDSGLAIPNGGISAQKITLQQGQNIMPPIYSDFEGEPTAYPNLMSGINVIHGIQPIGTGKFGQRSYGVIWGALSSNAILYVGKNATDYNIPVNGGDTYIISAYLWCAGAVATTAILRVKWSNGTTTTVNTQSNMPTTGTPATAFRVSGAVAAPAGVTAAMIVVESSTLTVNAGFNIDGIQVETKTSFSDLPSPWSPGTSTTINGGQIRTGEIRSTATAMVIQTTPIYNTDGTISGYGNPTEIADPAGKPAFIINANGSAEFGNLSVRGNVVVGNPNGTDNGETTNPSTLTASITSGSATITATSNFTFVQADVGLAVTGTGIPAGATIATYVSETQVTLSANATATNASANLSVARIKRILSAMSSANYSPGTSGWTLRSDGTAELRELSADSVDARVITNRQITGEHLASEVDIQSRLTIGSNIVIDPAVGMTIVSPSGNTIFPTDDSGIVLAGDIIANSLTVVDNLAIRGLSNEVAKGSVIRLSSGTTAPKTAPTVTNNWKTGNAHNGYNNRGLAKSPRSTNVWLTAESATVGTVHEASLDANGNLNYLYGWGFSMSALGRTEVQSALGGVATIGSDAYVLCEVKEDVPGTYYARYYVYKVNWNGSSWNYVTRWLYEPTDWTGGNSTYRPAIGTRANGNILIAQCSIASRILYVYEYTPAGAFVTSRKMLNSSGDDYAPAVDSRAILMGNFDFGSERILWAYPSGTQVITFDGSTRRHTTNDNFPLPASDIRGLAWDSATSVFRSRANTMAYEHTSITDAGPYIVGNTWVRGSSETTVGQTRSITMKKRSRLVITTAPIPYIASDTNSPNATKIYAGKTLGTMYLQSAPATNVNTATVTAIATGITPSGTGFAAGQSASLTDASGTGFYLNGDASGKVGPLVFNTAGIATAFNAPIYMQSGTVTITPSAANTPTSKSVTFATPFPTLPAVVVVPQTTVAGTTVTGWAVSNVSTTGFDAYVTRTNTTNTTLNWIATTATG